jgi:hypothetical protein
MLISLCLFALMRVAPVCQLPYIYNHMPRCTRGTSSYQFSPDFPKLVGLQLKFEDVMSNSMRSSIAAVDIKNVAIAVQDL